MVVPVEGLVRAAVGPDVAPAGGFAKNGLVDLVDAGEEQLGGLVGGHQAVVEIMLADAGLENSQIRFHRAEALVQVAGVEGARAVAAGRDVAGLVGVEVHLHHGVLGVVAEILEAALPDAVVDGEEVVGAAVRHGQRTVGVAKEVVDDGVVRQIRGIQEDREPRVPGAVRVAAHGLQVSLFRKSVSSHLPERFPAVDVAAVDHRHVAVGLDDVVVVLVAAEISFGEMLLGPFLELVEAPVMAVQEDVDIAAPGVGFAHLALHVAGEDVAAHDVFPGFVAAFAAPGVVLGGPDVHLVEFLGAFGAEERILQFGVAVFAAEEETPGVLGVAGTSAGAAPDPETAADVEARAAVVGEVHQLGVALPVAAVLPGVDVNAGPRVKEVAGARHDGEHGDLLEGRPHFTAVAGGLRDAGVHAVVEALVVYGTARPLGAGADAARGADDVV